MPAIPYARLSHIGISVRDIDRMIAFYRRVLGFLVSDRGPVRDQEYAYLSRDPAEHHQIVFATGRPPGVPTQIVQLSLELGTIADLRAMHAIVTADPEAGDVSPRAHGVAWSLYFRDPEDNVVETFVPTPWYVPAPAVIPYDFSMTDEEIFEVVRRRVQEAPGYLTYREWQDRTAETMRKAGVWPGPARAGVRQLSGT
jgi:catechol 2,3-dioxygenase